MVDVKVFENKTEEQERCFVDNSNTDDFWISLSFQMCFNIVVKS